MGQGLRAFQDKPHFNQLYSPSRPPLLGWFYLLFLELIITHAAILISKNWQRKLTSIWNILLKIRGGIGLLPLILQWCIRVGPYSTGDSISSPLPVQTVRTIYIVYGYIRIYIFFFFLVYIYISKTYFIYVCIYIICPWSTYSYFLGTSNTLKIFRRFSKTKKQTNKQTKPQKTPITKNSRPRKKPIH